MAVSPRGAGGNAGGTLIRAVPVRRGAPRPLGLTAPQGGSPGRRGCARGSGKSLRAWRNFPLVFCGRRLLFSPPRRPKARRGAVRERASGLEINLVGIRSTRGRCTESRARWSAGCGVVRGGGWVVGRRRSWNAQARAKAARLPEWCTQTRSLSSFRNGERERLNIAVESVSAPKGIGILQMSNNLLQTLFCSGRRLRNHVDS